jgi:hypothetical protein
VSLPLASNIEMPILQELLAIGGTDDVRFLYQRLISYFPSLSDAEIAGIKSGGYKKWRTSVQKAGRMLDEQNFIRRERGIWSLTEKGKALVEAEQSGFSLTKTKSDPLSHLDIQEMLLEIGQILGFYAEMEFEFYDVVWRESRHSGRLSHVFEVQSKGNIDSAFAKLKRAFDAQRSKPFLILASERDTNRAVKSLTREFRELQEVLTILSFVELRKIHDNLKALEEILPQFLKI